MKKKFFMMLMAMSLAGSTLTGCSSNAPDAKADEDRADLVLGATTGFFGAESLDVAYNWDGWIMSIYGISENLYKLDENYVPQPWIASGVETPDENTWVFTIRDGVTFSNGNTVDAQAVKACFERTYGMNERSDSTLNIESMEADGMTFTIKTSEPNPSLLNSICDPLLGIYDASEEPDEELGVSCTGSFIPTSFVAMTDVKMVANENYWGGAPEINTLELKIIDDEDALYMALDNNEIDLIAQAVPNKTSLYVDNDEYTIDCVTTTRANFVNYNLQSKGLDDVAVREAIDYCIDRESFADVVYQGYATPCYGIYPENLTFGGTDGLDIKVDEYNIEKAKSILKEAGYSDTDGDGILDKDGNNLSYKLITYSYNNNCIQLADMMEASLSEVGIEVNIETMDVLDEPMANGEYDMAVLNYAMAPIGTSSYFINMVFTTNASENYGKYSNEKVDTLAAKILTLSDQDEINKLTKELSQQVINDKPFSFVADQQLIFIYSNKVKGVQINPTEYYLVTNTLSVDK